MIVSREDGFHVLSEKGKNLGGPYKTRAQAVHRLQQVEYFKKQGGLMDVATETAPKFFGALLAGSLAQKQLMDMSYDKALVARLRSKKGLIGKEKQIANRITDPIEMKETGTFQRINTSPYHLPLVVGGIAGLQTAISKTVSPRMLIKAQQQQQKYTPLVRLLRKTDPADAEKLVAYLRSTNRDMRTKAQLFSGGFYTPQVKNLTKGITAEEIAKLKAYPAIRRMIPALLAGSVLVGTGYQLRNRKARQLLNAAKNQDDPSLFIRTKLHEDSIKTADVIPPTILVDSAGVIRRVAENVDVEHPENSKKKIMDKVKAIIDSWKGEE
jgi:hypothetical protein